MIHREIVYNCEECSYTTKRNNNMKKHTAQHKNRLEGSFVCDQCSYTSKQKGHLDIHVRSKHKGEVLKCEICNYSATQLSNLRRHRRAKHTELLPTLKSPLKIKTSFWQLHMLPCEAIDILKSRNIHTAKNGGYPGDGQIWKNWIFTGTDMGPNGRGLANSTFP